jgi:hypothetical protein
MKKPISLRYMRHDQFVSVHSFNIRKDGSVGTQLALLGDVPLADWVSFVRRAQEEIRVYGLDGNPPATLVERIMFEEENKKTGGATRT